MALLNKWFLGQYGGMGYLPQTPREIRNSGSRNSGNAQESAQLRRRLRHTVIIGLLVLTADWGSKAMLLQLSPSSVTPHYTNPNPLALLMILALAPLLLRYVNNRWIVIALGVCVGGCAGNLLQHMAGMPVTDFIPLPHLLANPACSAHYSCTLMFNVADLALWGSVPLLAWAFVSWVVSTVRERVLSDAVA